MNLVEILLSNSAIKYDPFMKKISLIILSIFSFYACTKNEVSQPQLINNSEQISTVVLSGFSKENPDSVFGIKWRDLDGFGGLDPIVEVLNLKQNQHYQMSLILLNEFVNPVDTISNEIINEAAVHQFFYYPDSILEKHLAIQVVDTDDNGKPLGLVTSLSVNPFKAGDTAIEGNLKIMLSHYDGIPKTEKPSPESDMEIIIPVRITN
jgi:hypothetical protein